MGGPTSSHTSIPAPPGQRPNTPYLSLHDGLQESQHGVPGLWWPFRLQQVCNSLPECFHCMLPPAKRGQRLGCAGPSTQEQRTEQNNRVFWLRSCATKAHILRICHSPQ